MKVIECRKEANEMGREKGGVREGLEGKEVEWRKVKCNERI